jgi:NADPH:quinone reductase-like Zn-dependent oxidoreductase
MLEEKVWPLVSDGTLKIFIDKVFAVSEANAAHKVLRDQSNAGKVILTFPGRQ